MSLYPDLHQKCMRSIPVRESTGNSEGCTTTFFFLGAPSSVNPHLTQFFSTARHLEMRDRWIPAIITESRVTSHKHNKKKCFQPKDYNKCLEMSFFLCWCQYSTKMNRMFENNIRWNLGLILHPGFVEIRSVVFE